MVYVGLYVFVCLWLECLLGCFGFVVCCGNFFFSVVYFLGVWIGWLCFDLFCGYLICC